MEPGDLAVLKWPVGRGWVDELIEPPSNLQLQIVHNLGRQLHHQRIQCYVLGIEDRDDPETTSRGWVARSCNRFLPGTPVVCTGTIWSSTYIQFMVAGRLLWAQKKYLELLV